jgi:small subunit ribosomal protein S11
MNILVMTPKKRASKKAERRKAKRKRARVGKKAKVFLGVAHIRATFTNCIVTISDSYGNALCWSSSGKCEYKGRKKRSHGAGGSVGADVGQAVVRQRRMKKVIVIIRGVGRARLAVVKGLAKSGLKILRIIDRTPRAFNGCRPRKRRRV